MVVAARPADTESAAATPPFAAGPQNANESYFEESTDNDEIVQVRRHRQDNA